jgi:hypothetical protein
MLMGTTVEAGFRFGSYVAAFRGTLSGVMMGPVAGLLAEAVFVAWVEPAGGVL